MEIRVEVTVCGENLLLRVINTIAPASTAGRDGIGLRNVRERLAVQFAETVALALNGAYTLDVQESQGSIQNAEDILKSPANYVFTSGVSVIGAARVLAAVS